MVFECFARVIARGGHSAVCCLLPDACGREDPLFIRRAAEVGVDDFLFARGDEGAGDEVSRLGFHAQGCAGEIEFYGDVGEG